MIAEEALPERTQVEAAPDDRSLRCRTCGEVLAPESAIRPVGGAGPEHRFINPAGVVHHLLSVMDVVSVRDHGTPTEDFSWFPGWSWRYTDCGRCGTFLGWCFEAVDGQQPTRFHGLRVQAISVG